MNEEKGEVMKWERMSAYVGAPRGFVPDADGEHEGFWQDYVEFFIEVIYQDQVFHNRITVHVDALKQFPSLYTLTLDSIVEGIDQLIKEKFPMSSKIRSTVVQLNHSEVIKAESVQELVRERAQPWLDELAKDDVRYDKIVLEALPQSAKMFEMDMMEVRVSVNVVEEQS